MRYVVDLDQNDLTWLAFAAGIATGAGNTAAQASLFGVLSRIQELPDETDAPVQGYEDAEALVEDFGGTLDERFMPPPPAPPINRPEDFGPGPVKGLG